MTYEIKKSIRTGCDRDLRLKIQARLFFVITNREEITT